MEYIKRHMEPYIQQAERAFKALLVTGARQVGKSTLLGNKTVTLNLDKSV